MPTAGITTNPAPWPQQDLATQAWVECGTQQRPPPDMPQCPQPSVPGRQDMPTSGCCSKPWAWNMESIPAVPERQGMFMLCLCIWQTLLSKTTYRLAGRVRGSCLRTPTGGSTFHAVDLNPGHLHEKSGSTLSSTPWTGHQSIIGSYRDKQPYSPINLTCMFLDSGRKPEYPERTHTYTGWTCKLHTGILTRNHLAVRRWC